jgi:purine-binding chemotaxis protein CheW
VIVRGIAMNGWNQLVVFVLDDQQYALNLACVERIVRAVEVTHLPEAPATIHGVINVEGRIIPVLNSRRLLGLPDREIDLQDVLIIVTEADRTVAVVGDEVRPVLELPEERIAAAENVMAGDGYVQGVTTDTNGMVIILTIENILAHSEQIRRRPVDEDMRSVQNA